MQNSVGIVVTDLVLCTALYAYRWQMVCMAVRNPLPHSCLDASLIFARMTRVMVSSCKVMMYMLRLAVFAHSRSMFVTTFCWKLNV